MFFCDECQSRLAWPGSMSKSFGRCEVCNLPRMCNSVASSLLPLTPTSPDPRDALDENAEPTAPADIDDTGVLLEADGQLNENERLRVAGLRRICKLHGGIRCVGLDGSVTVWRWDAKQNKPVIAKTIAPPKKKKVKA